MPWAFCETGDRPALAGSARATGAGRGGQGQTRRLWITSRSTSEAAIDGHTRGAVNFARRDRAMRKSAAIVLGFTLAASGLVGAADAAGREGGFHGGGGFRGGFGGGFRGGFYGGYGFGIYSCGPYLGAPYGYALPCGYYPYPGDFYSYPADGGPYPIESVAPPKAPYWYYCDDPKGYYPHVTSCANRWRAIPAVPPPPAPD